MPDVIAKPTGAQRFPPLQPAHSRDTPEGRIREAMVEKKEPSKRGFFRSKGFRSYLAMVALPVMLYGAYNAVATDRYAASASFVVRSSTSEGGGDLMDNLTGSVSAGSTKSDSYIVRRYLESADLVREIEGEFGLINLFGADRADLFQRLHDWQSFESRVDYWNGRVSSTYDNTSGILTLEVQAYAPEEAEAIAGFVMGKIGDLVNDLSHAAREASYAYAAVEMETSEARLREAQSAMKDFRTRNNIADPSASAGRDDMLVYELNKQIIDEEASLAVLQKNSRRAGPNVIMLQDRIEALKAQRDGLRGEIGDRDGGAVVTAAIMNDYEALQLDVEIARTRYVSTLDGLESARRDSERQQRYLAIFSHPYAADAAEYPRRLINTLIAFISLSLFWGISHFVVQMVRDHRQ